MSSLAVRIALLAGIGAIALTVPATASLSVSGSMDAPAAHAITAQYAAQPMCDEGGGRMRPCSMGGMYKKKKPKTGKTDKKD
jgi:hypothetical protein